MFLCRENSKVKNAVPKVRELINFNRVNFFGNLCLEEIDTQEVALLCNSKNDCDTTFYELYEAIQILNEATYLQAQYFPNIFSFDISRRAERGNLCLLILEGEKEGEEELLFLDLRKPLDKSFWDRLEESYRCSRGWFIPTREAIAC